MSSSFVRQLHTEIRIAGSPSHCVPLIQHVPLALDATDHLVGDIRAVASDADRAPALQRSTSAATPLCPSSRSAA